MWPLVTLPYFIVRKVLYKNYFKILFVRMEYFITFVTDRMLIISTDWFVLILITYFMSQYINLYYAPTCTPTALH